MSTYLIGFSLGFSLILAIGSQNAFVLKQGLKNQHILAICIVCALSDALLIGFGVAGFGVIVEKFPAIEQIARYGGAIFLSTYAVLSFKSALTTTHALSANIELKSSLRKAILMSLAFTWLNPHVYLDTVLLLGSISSQYYPAQWSFAGGAMSASFVFFFSLGYGARYLTPLFQRPIAWKVLELIVGIVMSIIAVNLLIGGRP